MNDKKYVQHFSGTGGKYEVRNFDESGVSWQTFSHKDRDLLHYLPKGEYVLCSAPDVWEDITSQCEVVYAGGETLKMNYGTGLVRFITWCDGFRLNKIKLSAYDNYEFAFVVEKKVG